MPEIVKEMPKVRRSGRKPTYNLERYFAQDKPVKLVQGTKEEVEAKKADFHCSPTTMRHNLYRLGIKSGVKLNTAILPSENGMAEIRFQVRERKTAAAAKK